MRLTSCCAIAGADADPDGDRQEREARLERRVAEDLLDVERREEEEREQAADHEQQHAVRARERADRKMPSRISGAGCGAR